MRNGVKICRQYIDLRSPPANQLSAPLFSSSSSSSSSSSRGGGAPPLLPPKLDIVPKRPVPLLPPCFSHEETYSIISHLDDEDPDQSPMRPTLGAAAGRAQSDGRGSAPSPPRVRPAPVGLFPLSDILKVRVQVQDEPGRRRRVLFMDVT